VPLSRDDEMKATLQLSDRVRRAFDKLGALQKSCSQSDQQSRAARFDALSRLGFTPLSLLRSSRLHLNNLLRQIMSKLLFITGNAGKLREVKSILLASSPGAFDLSSQDLDLPEIQGTTREVAAAKVKAAAEAVGGPCITEVSWKLEQRSERADAR